MAVIQNVLVAIVFVVSIYLGLKRNFDLTLFFIVISTVNAPLFKAFGAAIPFQYFALLTLMSIVVSSRVTLGFSLTKVSIENVYPFMLFSVMLIAVLSTFIVDKIARVSELLFQSLVGIIVRLLWIVIITSLLQRLSNVRISVLLSRVLYTLVIANLIACFVQLFIGLPEMFYALYYSPSITPLRVPLLVGRFTRAFGLFPSTVNLGPFAVLFASAALALRKYLVFVGCLAIGLLSLSKTAIIGLPLIVILWLALKPFLRKVDSTSSKRKITKRFASLVIIALGLVFVVGVLPGLLNERGFYFEYYFAYLRNPLRALDSRYNDLYVVSSIAETYEVIEMFPILGSGFTKIQNEFVGDSTFSVLLKLTGFVGLFISLFTMMVVITFFLKKRSMLVLVPISIIISGIGFPAWVAFEHMFMLQASFLMESRSS